MMGNDDLRRTAQPLVPSSLDDRQRGQGLHVRWYWLAAAPAFVVAGLALAWGFTLLLAPRPPAFLPSLPSPLGGIDLVAAGIVLAVGPVGLRGLLEDRRRRALESQFPDLLSDMAANRRAGFTLVESVELAARGDYGPLTPEVNTMAAHLSWNVPFEEALQRFAHRVDTPLVVRATTLILEAERSGGHFTDVLSAVARDAREIRHLDRERNLAMQTYTIEMCVTFLVFLGVVAVLQAQLLPQIVEATSGAGGEIVPGATVPVESYRTFFFTSAIVQALGSGSMAGIMARGRVMPGLIHAAVMTLLALLTFSVLIA